MKYGKYLDEKKEELDVVRNLQRDILIENLITVDECLKIIRTKNMNFWDKRIDQNDFLTVRIGMGNELLDAKIEYPEEGFTIEEDELRKQADALAEEFKYIENVPVSYSFYDNKEFNYEPLILDFFLYCCKKEGLSDINEVVGNIKFKNGKYVIKASSGADGVCVWDYKYLSSFLDDKYHVKSDIKSMSNFQGTSVNYGSMSSNDYKSALKEGKQII